jgi:predicted pyridoxine 5'-phosphate oxidase superfamily flavin-nucleotide-binding protein
MKPREPVLPGSPWHRGERALQAREGVAGRMDEIGRKFVRDSMPEQHRAFFAQLPFLVIGAVDLEGAPWATLLSGAPGFVASPDPRTLRVEALPLPGDPVRDALQPGASLGALGIELGTRRRNRANGVVAARDAQGFALSVRQSFGNCPQYIQTREPLADAHASTPAAVERLNALDDAARTLIASADTFFVASYIEGEGDDGGRAVDVSHRGGLPGFVRIDGDVLTIPDFAGNLQFNTLGNLLLNPRAGLCFVDFVGGELLQLTGTTELVLEGPEIERFAGAQRLWRCRVRALARQRGALGIRFVFRDYSPYSLRTGHWPKAGSP